MASAVVVAVPPVNVVVASMPVVPLVGVVMAARHVVRLMHPPVGMVAARLHVVVLVDARMVVMLARRDVVMFMHAVMRVVTALSHVVMDVRAGARIVVALVRMPMDDRAGRVRVMRLPRWPDRTNAGHAMNAGHPSDARGSRSDVVTHAVSSDADSGTGGTAPLCFLLGITRGGARACERKRLCRSEGFKRLPQVSDTVSETCLYEIWPLTWPMMFEASGFPDAEFDPR
jgi:hypothetical protein